MTGAGDASWLTWALCSACFAALTAVLAKVGVDGIDSDLATLGRTLVVAVVLTVVLASCGKLRPIGAVSPRSWLFLSLSGLATGASWLCYFRALKVGDASRVAPVDKLSVVIVALLGVLFLGEHLSLRAWSGVALIASGAVLVALG